MTRDAQEYEVALAAATAHGRRWLAGLAERPVGPTACADAVREKAAALLRKPPAAPEQVVDELADTTEPGLMAIGSGRFFGWVMGGTLPAALAADWLVSAWDQNAGMRYATPGVVGVEEAAAGGLLDVLGLPHRSAVGFTTGGTAANLTCLAAARHAVLDRVGWDVEQQGLSGGPRIRVIAGAEVHVSVDLALRYLGLGRAERVAADDQGRIRVDALGHALDTAPAAPTIVCLQAGNLHSGAFDDIAAATAVAHAHGAWVHVDGAFGLWAAASPALRRMVDGYEAADSWATDAHKTLNVPYDCGVAIVADSAALHAAVGARASYLITDGQAADPLDTVPEMSRRARGVPVWAALRSLGAGGVAALVDGLAANASALARGLSDIPGVEVLNDVRYTQICVSFGTDERTRAVTAAILAEGVTWMSGSRWAGRDVLRVSVSNAATDTRDIALAVDAVRRAAARVALSESAGRP